MAGWRAAAGQPAGGTPPPPWLVQLRCQMLSTVVSCQTAQENMYVEGSLPTIHFRSALKKGHFNNLRLFATTCDHGQTMGTPIVCDP